MARTNLQLKEITSINDVIFLLRDLDSTHQILDTNSGLYQTTRMLFVNVVGSLDDFDPSNPSQIASILAGLPEKTKGEEIERLVPPDKMVPEVQEPEIEVIEVAEEKGPQSRQLSPDEWNYLLEQYDKNRGKSVEEIANRLKKDPLLERYGQKTILEALKRKIELENTFVKKGISPQEADRLSDTTISKTESVRNLVEIEKGSPLTTKEQISVQEIATEIASSSYLIFNDNQRQEEVEAANKKWGEKNEQTIKLDKQALESKKIVEELVPSSIDVIEKNSKELGLNREATEVLKDQIKKTAEEIHFHDRVRKEAERIADQQIIGDEAVTSARREKVVEELTKSMEKVALDPSKEIDVPEVTIYRVGSQGLTDEVISPTLTEEINKILGDKAASGSDKKEKIVEVLEREDLAISTKKISEIVDEKGTTVREKAEGVIEVFKIGDKGVEKEVVAVLDNGKISDDEKSQKIANILENQGSKQDKLAKAAEAAVKTGTAVKAVEVLTEDKAVLGEIGEGGKVVETKPRLSERLVTITKSPNSENKVRMGVNEAGKAAKELAISADAAGTKLEQIRSQMLAKGFKTSEINEILKIRFPQIDGDKNWNPEHAIQWENQTKIEFAKENRSPSKINEGIAQAQMVKGLITAPGKLTDNVQRLITIGKRMEGIKGMEGVASFARKLEQNPIFIQHLQFVQDLTNWRKQIDRLTGGFFSKTTGNIMIQVGKTFGITGMEDWGAQLIARIGNRTVQNMATQFFEHGFEKGLANIIGGLFKGGVEAAAKGAATSATTAAGTAAVDGAVLAVGGSTGPPGWVIAAAIFALQMAGSLFKKVKEKVKGVIDPILTTLGFEPGKMERMLKNEFGGLLGGIINKGLQGAMVLGAVLVSIPGMIIMRGMVPAAIIVGVPLFFLWYGQTMTLTTQTAPFAPPRGLGGGGGVCIRKTDLESGGNVNCNTNVPECSVPGVSKDNFIDVAERWSPGGGTNAAKCFNDVVYQAINHNPPINPAYALWAWLHESDASNYNGGQVSDFGMAYLNKTNDFQSQLEAFLNLDPASGCPGISDYWLAWSTNMLGTCDPNQIVDGTTGNEYVEELTSTWSFISNNNLPSDIHDIGGASCGGSNADPGATEFDSSGAEFVCYGGGHVVPASGRGSYVEPTWYPRPTRDPNIPIPPGCPGQWPIAGNWPVTQGSEGPTHSNIPGASVDIMADGIAGQNVLVTHPGVVTFSGYAGAAYGNLVIVRGSCNGTQFVTYYAHLMDSQMISMNTTVTQGQTIGLVDNTGNYAPGNDHVHYEIRGCADPNSSYCGGASGFDPFGYMPVDVNPNCFWNCNVDTSMGIPTPTR